MTERQRTQTHPTQAQRVNQQENACHSGIFKEVQMQRSPFPEPLDQSSGERQGRPAELREPPKAHGGNARCKEPDGNCLAGCVSHTQSLVRNARPGGGWAPIGLDGKSRTWASSHRMPTPGFNEAVVSFLSRAACQQGRCVPSRHPSVQADRGVRAGICFCSYFRRGTRKRRPQPG